MEHPVKVDGYEACQDCAELAKSPAMPVVPPRHQYIPGPYGPCWRCGRVREDLDAHHPTGKADMPPSTNFLLGGQ